MLKKSVRFTRLIGNVRRTRIHWVKGAELSLLLYKFGRVYLYKMDVISFQGGI